MENQKKSFGLSTRIIATTLGLIVAIVAINYFVFVRGYRADAERSMVEKAAAFTAVADEAKNHASKLISEGAVDVAPLLKEMQDHVAKGGDYRATRVFETIPVVVGWTTAQKAAARENIDFKVPAFDARNPDNEPEPGSFRAELLRDLRAQVTSGGDESIYRIDKKTNTLHYMRAIKLDETCMMCHGAPAKYDTDGDGKDPLGFAMESWNPGDMHGAYEVAMPLDAADAQVAGFIGNGMMFTVPILIVAGIGFVFMLRYMLGKPLNNLIDLMKDVATGDGDLTKRVNLNRGDEIGRLAHWFDTFIANVHQIISDIAGVSREVASAATEIAASNEEMAAGLSNQQDQTQAASAAVEQLNEAAADIARQSADAAHQADSSRANAETGGKVVADTVSEIKGIAAEVDESAKAVALLGQKGEEIGGVISVINDIADQTNLLALNAAIEAARAGEHGRGFAVVADEVRKLAERTTQATEEVSQSIREIQEETTRAVERIENGSARMEKGVELATSAGESLRVIVDSSKQLLGQVQTIAAAAEEQSASAAQIGENVQRVTAVSNESAMAAGQASEAAAELSRQSERMRSLVDRFKL
ncbi:MAG: methyl-accepting chemotaxis protein [Phycisphaeraceae bacterium]|nr:MAG: methyl-accepting chemotaxis protein [Phycisphaeraceae bacterium]